MILRLVPVLGLATLLCFSPSLTSAADHPIAGDTLRLKDPGSPVARAAKFRSGLQPSLDASLADPRQVGATLQVFGSADGDGSSGAIDLAASRWIGLGNPAGSRGYRFIDGEVAAGVSRVDLRRSARGGRLTITAGGEHWPFSIERPQQSVSVRLTIGDHTWCSEFAAGSLRRNEARIVIGSDAPAPSSCRPPPCGNGVAAGTEECDDGNAVSGDGCSASCTLENTGARCRGVPTQSAAQLGTVLVASGYLNPTHLTAPPLDPRRLFVVEQGGRILVLHDGIPLETPFLDIQDRARCTSSCNERGLLSLAFHPDYERNGRFFVDYTNVAGDTVVARYQVSHDPDRADRDSEVVLFTIRQPFSNHNGGQLAFGPDGYLYVGMGDGGSQGDPQENGQSDTSLLGKILRLDVNVDTPPYHAVPPSNPHAEAGDPTGLIWSKGLRNPWRFAFDRANGDLYIGDVGQGAREEVDYQPASSAGGENYGWNVLEGTSCYDPEPHFPSCPAALPFLTPPVYEYDHGDPGKPCSITGGFVYRGCRMPDLAGNYFFADYCSDQISTLRIVGGVAQDLRNRSADLDPPDSAAIDAITSFGEDARGEIYILDRGGQVYRIVPR